VKKIGLTPTGVHDKPVKPITITSVKIDRD
jgi:hypothetical protein